MCGPVGGPGLIIWWGGPCGVWFSECWRAKPGEKPWGGVAIDRPCVDKLSIRLLAASSSALLRSSISRSNSSDRENKTRWGVLCSTAMRPLIGPDQGGVSRQRQSLQFSSISFKAGVWNLCLAGQKRPESWRFVTRGKVQISKQALRFLKSITNLPWVGSELSNPQSLTHAAVNRRPIWFFAFGPAVLHGFTSLL